MEYNRFDIYKFIEKVKEKNFHEIISDAQNEINKVENLSFSVKGAIKAREEGSLEYADELKALLFLLENNKIPYVRDNSLIQAFKTIYEKLVNKKQLNDDFLKIFKQ